MSCFVCCATVDPNLQSISKYPIILFVTNLTYDIIPNPYLLQFLLCVQTLFWALPTHARLTESWTEQPLWVGWGQLQTTWAHGEFTNGPISGPFHNHLHGLQTISAVSGKVPEDAWIQPPDMIRWREVVDGGSGVLCVCVCVCVYVCVAVAQCGDGPHLYRSLVAT